jgi:hypothetical protein
VVDGYPTDPRARQSAFNVGALNLTEDSGIKVRQGSSDLFQVTDGALKTHIQAIV